MLLPESLRPWRPWLDWFAPELAVVLGDLVRRLQPLLGSHSRNSRTPEPMGLDDLRRRGPYERLLLSEWAIADAAPDEFLRRAANGEHLFLAPRETAGARPGAIVAVFDTGPLQLGAPRLAHLALWILLARRAAEAKAEFLWGTVQQPGVLTAGDSPEKLQQLLRARSLSPATPSCWQAWHDRAASASLLNAQWWNIGRQHELETFAAHQVAIVRALQDEALDVLLREPRRERKLRLPLPPADPAVRLLKGAFLAVAHPEVHRAVPDKFSLRQPAYIAVNGRHVVVATLDQRVQVFQVPESPETAAKKHRNYQCAVSSNLMGIAMSGKNLGGIVVAGPQLQFWQLKGFGTVPRPEPEKFAITPGLAHWRPCIWLKGDKTHRIYALDPKGNLVFWDNRSAGAASSAAGLTHDCRQRVIALAQLGYGWLAYARAEGDNRVMIGIADSGKVVDETYITPVRTLPKKVFFTGKFQTPARRVAWAFDTSSDEERARGSQRWQLYEGEEPNNFSSRVAEFPASWEACGLVRNKSTSRPDLVVLHPDKTSLMLVSESGSATVFTSPEKIETLSVSPSCGHVAMLTQQRRLIVYSLTHRSMLLSVASGKDGYD